MKLRLNDIKLFSSAPVLYNVARYYMVPGDLMLMILSCLHSELGSLDSDADKQEKLQRENPELPSTFKKEHLALTYASKSISLGLLEEVEESYSLSSKAIAVFEKTSKLQKEMDKRGLPICPRYLST